MEVIYYNFTVFFSYGMKGLIASSLVRFTLNNIDFTVYFSYIFRAIFWTWHKF